VTTGARFVVASILAALAFARPARAEPSEAARAEIAALEAEIQRASALAGGGCAVACPALASMQRAADRICALDPGPRCDAARAKVRDARRMVEQACPECATGGKDTPPPLEAKEKAPAPSPPPPPPAPPPVTVAESAPPPPAAPRHGGCAGCATNGDPAATTSWALAALALLALARRRRRR
jgi:MYXO-CTERM domain-containing protein